MFDLKALIRIYAGLIRLWGHIKPTYIESNPITFETDSKQSELAAQLGDAKVTLDFGKIALWRDGAIQVTRVDDSREDETDGDA